MDECSYDELIDRLERNGEVCAWDGTAAFSKRLRVLPPSQYQIVTVKTRRGSRRALVFSDTILQAEWEAKAPERERRAQKRKIAMERAERDRLAADRALGTRRGHRR